MEQPLFLPSTASATSADEVDITQNQEKGHKLKPNPDIFLFSIYTTCIPLTKICSEAIRLTCSCKIYDLILFLMKCWQFRFGDFPTFFVPRMFSCCHTCCHTSTTPDWIRKGTVCLAATYIGKSREVSVRCCRKSRL